MPNTAQTIFDALGRHPIHPFPARMAPGIALNALADATKPLRVLDPMMGSGTVLAVARAHGHHAIGVDLDPLAVLLSRVWTTPINEAELVEKGREVLSRAKIIYAGMTVGNAYPLHSESVTRKFIRYWFDEHARRQLASLSIAIGRVRPGHIKDALWCAFSRLIITKSYGASLAMDLSHSRPHRVFDRAPAKPFDHFESAIRIVGKNSISSAAAGRGPRSTTILGDARALKVKDKSIDLVLTSPPYLNAIDYMRCSKFSLVWMGHETKALSETRSMSIGSEASQADATSDEDVKEVISDLKLRPALTTRNSALLSRYIWDMRKALGEVSRVLKKNGRAVYVVGDSTVHGTFVRNSRIVQVAAESCGLACTERRSRILPANRRYLPPPDKAPGGTLLDGRMRKEVLLTFQK